jgi:hypothetical protein
MTEKPSREMAMTNSPHPSPYTGTNPPLRETADELRARIPGWGADLDRSDRPAVPKMRSVPTGAHWDVPEQQPEHWPRERSVEHAVLTPVFGTSCPPKGLSGRIRRLAYARHSEATAAHWLLLIAADRVDTVESMLGSFLTAHPDNVVTETGARSELTHGGLSSRLGQGRADVAHHPLDPVIVLGPWVLAGAAGFTLVRRVRGWRPRA